MELLLRKSNMQFIRRILVTFVTSFVFVIVASLLTVLTMKDSYGFIFYCIAYLVYGAPAIFIIGFPFSILLDKVLYHIPFKNKWLYLVTAVILYAGAGFVGSWIYLSLLFSSDGNTPNLGEVLSISTFGVGAALLFLVIHYVMNLLLDYPKRTKR